MKINLEDSKGQIITSYEIQEDDTLENIDGFYEVRRENDTRSYSTQRRQNSSNERANFMLERKRKAA